MSMPRIPELAELADTISVTPVGLALGFILAGLALLIGLPINLLTGIIIVLVLGGIAWCLHQKQFYLEIIGIIISSALVSIGLIIFLYPILKASLIGFVFSLLVAIVLKTAAYILGRPN